MSTSIAALPAYKSSKATRTKARADRTIFGTTLDNSTKATKIFQNEAAHLAAQHLFEQRHKKWETPTASRQALIDGAWGIKDYSQAEIAEEYTREYSRANTCSTYSACSTELALPARSEVAASKQKTRPKTPLVAFKDRYGVYNVLKENVPDEKTENLAVTPKTRAPQATKVPKLKRLPERRRRRTSMSRHASKQPKWSSKAVQVPKFPLASGDRNYMRTASLKITETGAKDLIHAGPINKIGLGDTLQYNHESFKKRETPNQYRDHGNVFSLGQRGHATTTNSEVTGPGGFYEMSSPETKLNERQSKRGAVSEYSLPYAPSVASSRRTYDAARRMQVAVKPKAAEATSDGTPAKLDDVIPRNIIHKFGSEEVSSLFQGREHEVKLALHEAKRSALSHSGMVPPRIDVPELNHPIDPPPSYYSNFGQSLKYDKFDGGLHLYIH